MLPPTNREEDLWLIMDAEAYYSSAKLGFDEDDAFYEGLLEEFLDAPEGMEPTIPTTARAVVDEAVDNTVPEDIMVMYSPRGIGETPENDADVIRRYCRALVTHWRQTGNDIDILRDFIKNLFKSGKAIFKCGPDWTLWPSLDAETEAALEKQGGNAVLERAKEIKRIRANNVAIFCRSIAPQCILEDPTISTRKLWVIERYEASISEVQNIYSVDYEPFRNYRNGAFREVPIHEIWTASYVDHTGKLIKGRHAVYVMNDQIVDEPNPYDRLPYVIKYSGFGRESYEGTPETKAVGFYTRQNKSMFLSEARRFTQFDAIMTQLAWPVGFMPESVDVKTLDFTPGSVNFIPEDVMDTIEKLWVVPKIPDAEYLNSLNAISNQIERGTVQRALRGAGVPGTDSAAQYSMIATQSRLRIESVKVMAQFAVAEALSLALYYIDQVFGQDTSVFIAEGAVDKYTVGPKNIKGHYRVGVTFKVNEDAEKERKLVIANDAVAKGGLSLYDALVFAGFENPMELIARRNAYELMQEPLIKRAMAKRILEEWGIDADALELEEQQAKMEQQFALNQMVQQLQLGTGRDQPGPVPTDIPMDSGAGAPVADMGLPPGAPPAVQQSPGVNDTIQQMQGLGAISG